MAHQKRSISRGRPAGWRGESHRHYLAAKGISTKRYFVNNMAKGNRNLPGDPYASIRKSLNAQGYSSSEQTRLFNIPPKPQKDTLVFDVPDRDELNLAPRGFSPDALDTPPEPEQEFEQEVQVDQPIFVPQEPQQEALTTALEEQDESVTPGVPPPPPTTVINNGQQEIFPR